MDAEVADRAFEPFFTTKPAGEGTGLGLATVHGIVTDSGGEIAIDSAPGSGTVVRFTLPAARERARPSRPSRRARSTTAAGSARVLVVEDQDPVRRQAVRILERARLRGAAGRQRRRRARRLGAGRRARHRRRDAGHDRPRARQARRRAARPACRVVFMSGHTEDVVLLDGAREREIAFVQKPFTRDTLLGAVARALHERDAAPDAQAAPGAAA